MNAKAPLSASGRATFIASMTALFLVVIKLIVGLTTGTVVLIASAMDSGLDFLVSVFNHFAVRRAEEPGSQKYNYGLGKLEALASFAEGVVICISALAIVIIAISKFDGSGLEVRTMPAIWVMIASTAITLVLVLYLNRVAKATRNLVLKADALHYRIDLLTNIGILAALFIIKANADFWWIDPAFSIAIAIYIAYGALGLIKEGLSVLLDRAIDLELVEQIERILKNTSERLTGYHYLRTRESGGIYYVEAHLVFNKEISLLEAHRISVEVEKQIQAIPDCKWQINFHLDPEDDRERDLREDPLPSP